MDDHFDIAHVFEIGKFDITRLTCIFNHSGEKVGRLVEWLCSKPADRDLQCFQKKG